MSIAIHNEELVNKYVELKAQEAEIKAQLEAVKGEFEKLEVDEITSCDIRIFKRNKQLISYKDSIKDYLKQQNVFEECVSADKNKIKAMVKQEKLNAEDLKQYEDIKEFHTWETEKIAGESDE